MRVLDLFSGIGGFSLGLERAGFKTVAFCEIEPYCQAVLRKHWSDVPIYGDIRELTGERLKADGISVDVICGGFPCQDISLAGKGAGIKGERSGLWSEYARIIGEVRPRYVIVENVAALLGRGLERVLGDLAAFGFDAEWHCIPASAVGAPHRRDRVWIVAHACSERRQQVSRSPYGDEATNEGRPTKNDHKPSSNGQGHGKADVAHARCECGPEIWAKPLQDKSVSELHYQRCSEDVADARRQLLEGWCGQSTQGSTQWLTEPDVGRVASRLSNGLDGGVNAHESCLSKARSKGIPQTNRLRFLRQYIESSAASSEPPRCAFCAHPLSSLPCEGGCSPWAMGSWRKENQNLRCLREGLPEILAQSGKNLQQIMPNGDWQAECEQAVGNRVARLRALGNAVVPQIPEMIGRAILSACPHP